MSKKKLTADITSTDPNEKRLVRVWVTKDMAQELKLTAEEDWLYMRKDFMGVLSTQAKIEGIVDEPGFKIYATPDVLTTAHFKNPDKIICWKVTEWE